MEACQYDWADPLEPAALKCLAEPGALVSSMRCLTAVVLRGWLSTYSRLTIVGRENLPANRSFILVANHASHLDTLCLLSALPIRQLNCAFPVAAHDYFCVNPVRSLLAKVIVNVMPFDRRLAPWYSLSVCANLLRKPGTVLIWFPEGTRTGGKAPHEFKPGVGLLAAGHDVPVVPCHLAGTDAALPKGAWIPRPSSVRLTIGTPRVYAHLPATKESRTQVCRELRDAVNSLGGDDQ